MPDLLCEDLEGALVEAGRSSRNRVAAGFLKQTVIRGRRFCDLPGSQIQSIYVCADDSQNRPPLAIAERSKSRAERKGMISNLYNISLNV